MTYQWGKVFTATILVAGLGVQAQAAEKITVFAAASLTNA